MKITNVAKSPSFACALSTNQENRLRELASEALSDNHLGINSVSTTLFDFSVPAGKYNTGIGTTFSKEGIDTAEFAKTYFGVNTMQVGPQGKISNFVRSPYSGTTFSLGVQNISPERLTTDEYANLLTHEDIDNSPYMNTVVDDKSVDYEHVFSDSEGIKPLLVKAYQNFKALDKVSPLKQEFEDFRKANTYWLERDCVYDALSYKNGTEDCELWPKNERELFADENNIDQSIIDKARQITDECDSKIVEYSEFVQFIADKQQKQTKEELNARGILLSGDCQIGFSQRDVWAHKSAFYKNGEMFGCDINGDGKFITCWSAATDMDKLNGEAGELYRQKFAKQFERYNALRIDAAWQLIYPTIVMPTHKDSEGNLRGNIASNQPQVGKKIIDIIASEAGKASVDENRISLELLDGAGKSWKALSNPSVKNAIKNMNCIHTMQYMNNGWGYPAYYRSDKAQAFKHPFEISIGTHDNDTAITFADSLNGEQIGIISKELKKSENPLRTIQQRLSGLFAMLFTNTPTPQSRYRGRVSMTITDAVGSNRRINLPNTQNGNWEFRLGRDWQEKYFTNLINGYGFNLPEALSTALKAKEGNSRLTQELDSFASVLKRKDGPMTRQEANKWEAEGRLNTIL